MGTVGAGNNVRDGHGRYRRTLDRVERDVWAAMLHAQGKTYDEIADALGFAGSVNSSALSHFRW